MNEWRRFIPKFGLKIWGTLTEPRIVTFFMVVIYGLSVVSAVSILLNPHRGPIESVVATICMGLGGAVGIPASWRGSWWLEGPAALLICLGMSMLAAIEGVRAIAQVEWPHHTLVLTLIIMLFFLVRAAIVWPQMYRPGVIPASNVELAKARMEGAQAAERFAAINQE